MADEAGSNDAPGAPGISPTWTSSAKDMVSTALGSSRVWATIGHGIDHHWQCRDMIEMTMGQKNVVDGGKFGNRQFADAGTGINEDVVVD